MKSEAKIVKTAAKKEVTLKKKSPQLAVKERVLTHEGWKREKIALKKSAKAK